MPPTGRPELARTPERAAVPRPGAPVPSDAGASGAPSGTSREQRYDAVGYATWYGDLERDATTASGTAFDPDAIAAAHRTLPLGSIAEVTALDSGLTILVRITDRGPHDPRYEIDLTRGAAGLLKVVGGATPVRVRAVNASAADAAALARGEAASSRIDAPPALLAALRRQLPDTNPAKPDAVKPAAVAPASRPAPNPAAVAHVPTPRPVARAAGGYVVQVAAFSTQPRAAALANSLGGSVQPAGAVWRVRLGPFAEVAAAQRARDGAARRGYADAKVMPNP